MIEKTIPPFKIFIEINKIETSIKEQELFPHLVNPSTLSPPSNMVSENSAL
jgi:hypothetical protein